MNQLDQRPTRPRPWQGSARWQPGRRTPPSKLVDDDGHEAAEGRHSQESNHLLSPPLPVKELVVGIDNV